MLTNWEKTFPGQIIKYNNKKYVFICIEDSNMIKMKVGGYIIDTPGFSSIEVPNIENREELISLFPEFSNIESCKFLNCSHTHEPGCNVKKEVEENKISKDRYDFYKKTLEILLERWNRYD